MPASSVDTFLACSIMIILVLSVMAGTSKQVAPYLQDLSHQNDAERFQSLASYLLLHTGTPSNWGQTRQITPSSLGLAKTAASHPYELDIDKISRLNSENAFSFTYSELWQSFGVADVAFQIEMRTLFDLSIGLVSNQTQGGQTTYEFEVEARKSGLPVSADLSGYVVIEYFVESAKSSTSSDGVGSLVFNVPNSVNGTTLLLVFAKAKANQQIVSFSVYAFAHNSPSYHPNRTFLNLSPLNHILNASFTYPSTEIWTAQVFSFNYNFSLSKGVQGDQSAEYDIPSLMDSSAMIIVLTGLQGSSSFAEWVAYPQLPLQIGVDFDQSIAGTIVVSQSRIVTLGFALYQIVTRWGGTA